MHNYNCSLYTCFPYKPGRSTVHPPHLLGIFQSSTLFHTLPPSSTYMYCTHKYKQSPALNPSHPKSHVTQGTRLRKPCMSKYVTGVQCRERADVRKRRWHRETEKGIPIRRDEGSRACMIITMLLIRNASASASARTSIYEHYHHSRTEKSKK